jgi:hypothetical protein
VDTPYRTRKIGIHRMHRSIRKSFHRNIKGTVEGFEDGSKENDQAKK